MTGDFGPDALLVGRVWDPAAGGPCVVTLRDGTLVDITSREAPTVRDLLERDDPAGFAAAAPGRAYRPARRGRRRQPRRRRRHALLAPCDLQALKACGVTFARSMVERVIEERAAGDPDRAAAIRDRIAGLIGASLRDIRPGSAEAAAAKAALQAEGLWSQYLEVGIGPDAEVFTKGQPMSAVGWGATVGLHPASRWNNPEPEVVLAVDSRGRIKGATLGNDVNLRDVEGRSALLLGKAKDNNAACAIGPFIRLLRRRLHPRRRAGGRADADRRGRRTASASTAARRCARSAATPPTSSPRPSAGITSIRTASCCFSAPCSPRSRTATRRARASPTTRATS